MPRIDPHRGEGRKREGSSHSKKSADAMTHGLNSIADVEWAEIDVVVDSGATEAVMAADTFEGVVDITKGPAFARGVKYEVANGVQIPNLGEWKFVGVTEEGVARKLTAQV